MFFTPIRFSLIRCIGGDGDMDLSEDLPVDRGSGRERAEARWGDVLSTGFTVIPEALLRNQARLGLRPQEMNVLIQLLSYWWRADSWPRPRVSTLASRLGVDERTIQRSLAALREKGFVKRVKVAGEHGDELQAFDLSGLVSRLGGSTLVTPSVPVDDFVDLF